MSSLQFIKALVGSKKKASELAETVVLYPQVLVNAKVSREGKTEYRNNAEIISAIDKIEKRLQGEGRVLIRPSGTESLVRVMIEGKDESEISEMAKELAELIASKY